MDKVKVGIIGCGNIFKAYAQGCRRFEILDVVTCADIDIARAKVVAEEHKIPKACSVEELLADKSIDIVVNLTIPSAHAEINMKILEAGKHAYTEKPFATKHEDGVTVHKKAKEKGLLIGSAPDTFLGAGLQTCRKIVDDGWIGKPIGAAAFFCGHGMESWHPNPEFFFKAGGGPMLDIGPYPLTALVTIMGSIKRVTGSTAISFPERIVTSQGPNFGQRIKVEVPTHYVGTIDFANGAVATMMASFDMWKSSLPRIEIYGTEGTLQCPDPNTFAGPVKVFRPGSDPKTADFTEIPLTHIYNEQGRGMGVADMAYAITFKRKHRATGDLGLHILDVMLAFEEASKTGKHVEIQSSVERPAMIPLGLRYGTLDEK
ncbi:MAG: Gfo/Idh/MocA family oxidoreductase [Spirochaetes bacterium]|nr:Gfo/Idh/MocA family oxidoreductase [Spirochaetota bacterium]